MNNKNLCYRDNGQKFINRVFYGEVKQYEAG